MPKCPVCKSSRIRRGYRPTPVWSKIILRFNLLCENCNWEFRDFALAWKLPAKSIRHSKKRYGEKNTVAGGLPNNSDESPEANVARLNGGEAVRADEKKIRHKKRKVKIKLSSQG
ncbi:MAG: hypothetical protein ACR2GD_01875 [Pyrinomonadaceae bacterium]